MHRLCAQLMDAGFLARNVDERSMVVGPALRRLALDVGTHVPLHCTASSKLFLSFMNAARRNELLAQLPLPRLTANTLTTRRALRAECEAIAAHGRVAVALPAVGWRLPPGRRVWRDRA